MLEVTVAETPLPPWQAWLWWTVLGPGHGCGLCGLEDREGILMEITWGRSQVPVGVSSCC